jgi:ubiquinol-cytochrome c reductase cytochrome b subunit
MTLAFGLTGYLLPWDNRAYWGTTVTVNIASQAPGAGPYLLRLLGSEGGAIGVVTFARFYAVHVLLLPPLVMLLILLHVILVRRHGVAPAPDDVKPQKKFYPEQVFKDTAATFLWFAVLVGMAIFARVPLGHAADPTDTSFIPRPEWYFLFLFQILRVFDGPLEIVGSLVIPTLAMILLFLTPFIDRGKMISIRRRTGAIALAILFSLGWGGLTARAVATTPPSTQAVDEGLKGVEAWQQIPADQLAAIGFFRKDNCTNCHTIGRPGAAPDLAAAPSQKPADWLMQHFNQPAPNVSPTTLKGPQLKLLATFVAKRDDAAVEAWKDSPPDAVEGAMVYQSSQCSLCHELNGVGQKTGPPLNGLAGKRTRQWLEGHFNDPPKFSPGSTMPAYKFNSHDMDRIIGYLLAIPKP